MLSLLWIFSLIHLLVEPFSGSLLIFFLNMTYLGDVVTSLLRTSFYVYSASLFSSVYLKENGDVWNDLKNWLLAHYPAVMQKINSVYEALKNMYENPTIKQIVDWILEKILHIQQLTQYNYLVEKIHSISKKTNTVIEFFGVSTRIRSILKDKFKPVAKPVVLEIKKTE